MGFSETDELISTQAPYLDPNPHELLKRNHEQSGKLDVDRIWETTTGLYLFMSEEGIAVMFQSNESLASVWVF